MSSTSLPKLSYVLLSHNREKYIRGAIESAFAQDYEGELEYIFSDDCSTDRTFEIIKECVAAYKGNRRVVVTQTPKNLHLAGNTNHAVQFVTSDWIVRADDDDFSTPNRCSLIGKAIAANPGCSFVYTKMKKFTNKTFKELQSENDIISQSITYEKIDFFNGTHDFKKHFGEKNTLHQVWSARHYEVYGPLPEEGYFVDDIISNLRCCTLGHGIKINAITAYIRNNSGNMSHGYTHEANGYQAVICREKFNDKYYNISLTPMLETYNAIQHYISRQHHNSSSLFLKAIEEDLSIRMLQCSYWRCGILNRIRISHRLKQKGVFAIIRCFPLPLFAFFYSFAKRIKNLLNRVISCID